MSELLIGYSNTASLFADALQPQDVTVTITNAGSTGHDVRLR